ncbi:hypothetical protein V2J09_013527 [Rumex salicifolius]
MFNSGLEGVTKIKVKIIMTSYKDGFEGIDVGLLFVRGINNMSSELRLRTLELLEGTLEGRREAFNETTVKMDLLMMAHYIGGKERTNLEWTNLLEDSGFSRITFIKILSIYFIIEAYACSATL